MLKKVLRNAAIAGVALAASLAVATPASAVVDVLDVPASASADVSGSTTNINIGNNLCLLPWYWPGPFNVGVNDMSGSYSACNGGGWEASEGINIGNNMCVLPWMWQGPFNVLVNGLSSHYEACNG